MSFLILFIFVWKLLLINSIIVHYLDINFINFVLFLNSGFYLCSFVVLFRVGVVVSFFRGLILSVKCISNFFPDSVFCVGTMFFFCLFWITSWYSWATVPIEAQQSWAGSAWSRWALGWSELKTSFFFKKLQNCLLWMDIAVSLCEYMISIMAMCAYVISNSIAVTAH